MKEKNNKSCFTKSSRPDKISNRKKSKLRSILWKLSQTKCNCLLPKRNLSPLVFSKSLIKSQILTVTTLKTSFSLRKKKCTKNSFSGVQSLVKENRECNSVIIPMWVSFKEMSNWTMYRWTIVTNSYKERKWMKVILVVWSYRKLIVKLDLLQGTRRGWNSKFKSLWKEQGHLSMWRPWRHSRRPGR